MSPGPLRPESVQRRLVEMRALLDVLGRHVDATGADLRRDLERRLVVERALQQLVDLAVKVNAHIVTASGAPAPSDYHDSFTALAAAGAIDPELARALAPSAGLRNRLVHEYDDLDLDVVAAAMAGARDLYADYVRQVADWLSSR